jgi:hypothetical protein
MYGSILCLKIYKMAERPTTRHENSEYTNINKEFQLSIWPRRSPGIIADIHKILVLLEVLDPTRGERSKSGYIDVTQLDIPSIRRAFIDSVASLCASEKDPDYVTAAALRQTPQGKLICLAGNSNIKSGVVDFLKQILEILRDFAKQVQSTAEDQARSLTTEKLLSMIIPYWKPKIHVYYGKAVNRYVPQCLSAIKSAVKTGECSLFYSSMY